MYLTEDIYIIIYLAKFCLIGEKIHYEKANHSPFMGSLN